MNSFSSINLVNENANDYLKARNKKFYRGNTTIIHPLYKEELKNAISQINNFLAFSILKKAYYLRLKTLYALSADKCFNNNANSYTFAEAEVCEETLLEKDSILNNIENFKKEVEVRIQDAYEKNVKSDGQIDIAKFEKDHRKFLLNLHMIERFNYYFLAKRLFIDAVKNE